jgi:hypothetical protein
MKHPTVILLIGFLLLGTGVSAQEAKRVPSFHELQAIAGTHVDGEGFVELLGDFDFSRNPKRERSWGSGFGVFLAQSKTGIVHVGIRPPSRMTNMATYPGKLPRQLAPEDSAETIERKLGKPDRIVETGEEHLIMHYDGFHIILLGGRLFEIWLTQSPAQGGTKR